MGIFTTFTYVFAGVYAWKQVCLVYVLLARLQGRYVRPEIQVFAAYECWASESPAANWKKSWAISE